MKLSQLVKFVNNLDAQSWPDPEQVCQKELGELCRLVQEAQPNLQNRAAQLEHDRALVKNSLENFRLRLSEIKKEIITMIEAMQPAYFAESYRLHDREMIRDTDQMILDRGPTLDQSVHNYILSRINLHSDWHHAAMIIRPGQGHWLPAMVGSDPLYLVDTRSSLLAPSVAKFGPEYQRRLRQYLIRENDADGHVLRELPDSQFGFCLAVDFFHFKPVELIRLYLSEIYCKLKPGGTLGMTFNDCDRWGGVDLAERHFMCYTPGTMLLSLAESLGFETQLRYNTDNANTWVELRKPGTLTSIRGGQSLAKIVANS